MARTTFKAGDDFALKLSRLSTESNRIAKQAIYAGAKVVADEIKSNLEGALSPEATGDLVDSFGITTISRDRDGNWNAKLGFDGYDRNGVPNQLKARALESGTSKQTKRPFVRPAVNRTRKIAQAEMARVIDEEINKLED